MPPKKAVKTFESSEQPSLNNSSVLLSPTIPSIEMPYKKPSTLVKFSTNDSDRLQLAQAINNITLSGDTFVRAIETLSSFSQERLSDLDMQIESKKREYEHMNTQLENNFKNNQIETQQRLNEFKVKACEEIAKEYNMQVIRNEDYYKLKNDLSNVQKELNDINKTFDDRLFKDVEKERQLYLSKLQQESTTLTLNHKAQMAEITAQCAQQKKEIEMLNKTIENLKHEVAEQRNLTKEVAIASSKAQITQQIGRQDK
jgi:hypothetical protein